MFRCTVVTCLLVNAAADCVPGGAGCTDDEAASLLQKTKAVVTRSHSIGVSLPLSAFPAINGNPPALQVTVTPISKSGTPLAPQKLMVDSGSAKLAFCDSSLASQFDLLSTYSPPPPGNRWIEYQPYGNTGSGFFGQAYMGNLSLGGVTTAVAPPSSVFFVVDFEKGMPCNKNGFQGIFGINFKNGFWGLNASNAQLKSCTQSSAGCGGVISATFNVHEFVAPPIYSFLFDTLAGAEKLIGIWYTGEGDNAGMLYIGDTAKTNSHFNQDTATGPVAIDLTSGDYAIDSPTITLTSAGGSVDIDCTKLAKGCLFDTGTPGYAVPKEVKDLLSKGNASTVSFNITLAGATTGSTVTLSLTDVEQDLIGVENGMFFLGLPFWEHYYTVLDMSQIEVQTQSILRADFDKAKPEAVKLPGTASMTFVPGSKHPMGA